MRALSVEPDQRYPDAAALGAELARLKAKLAPEVSDADVARLMCEVFAEEKAAEDAVLAELLGKDPSRALTEQIIPAKLAPPTALAFEHSGLDAPEDFVPAEDTPEVSSTSKPPAGRRETREAQVSFGMDVEGEPEVGMVEARRPQLVRAIEEDEEEIPTPAAETGAAARRRWIWLALGLFLGASAAGFGVVWLLAR